MYIPCKQLMFLKRDLINTNKNHRIPFFKKFEISEKKVL